MKRLLLLVVLLGVIGMGAALAEWAGPNRSAEYRACVEQVKEHGKGNWPNAALAVTACQEH